MHNFSLSILLMFSLSALVKHRDSIHLKLVHHRSLGIDLDSVYRLSLCYSDYSFMGNVTPPCEIPQNSFTV